MELFTLVNGQKRDQDKEKACKFGEMEVNTRATGKKTKHMVTADSSTLMVIAMRVSG